ncbi:acyl-CoA-binding protein, partial [Syncephalis pseudoplumigaleata]
IQLYGLYMQATEGDCLQPRPGSADLDDVVRWDAWTSCAGMSRNEAKQRYISQIIEV